MIIQPVTLVSGNTVAMSVDIDFLTNEPGVGPHFTIDLIEFAFSKPPDAAGGGPQAIWFLKIFDVKGLLGTRPNPVGAVVGLAPGTVPVEPLPAPLVPAPGTGFAGHTGFVHFDIPVPQNVVDAFLVTFPDGNFIVEMNVHECFVEPPPPPKPCLPMGIFAGGDPAADLVHNWTLRSPQDGQIDLKIGALTVNAANGGAVKAVITDEPGEQMVEVAHPPNNGETAFATLTLTLRGGVNYDLSISLVPPLDTALRQAHHYTVEAEEFVDLSPKGILRYQEDPPRDWRFNADANERVTIVVSVDEGQFNGGAGQATSRLLKKGFYGRETTW